MSTQYSNGGETNASAAESAASAGTANTGQTSSAAASVGQSASSSLNWGSARSDYGEEAYGGTLNEQGLGGLGYDDFSEGRERAGSRRESDTRGARGRVRAGYSLGDTGSTGLTLLAGMVIGATLMYIFDPEQGGRRRSLLRDKLVAFSSDATDALSKTSRDLRNRTQGVIAGTTKALGLGGQEASGAGDSNAQGESSAPAQQANAMGA